MTTTRAPRSARVPSAKDREIARLRGTLVAFEREKAELLIENGRLRGAVAEAREQETATAELLRLLSHSAGDIQPVLNGIVERAARLCDASDAVVFLEVGEKLRPVSVMDVGLSPSPVTYEVAEALVAAEAQRLGRRRPTGTLDVPLDDTTAPGRAHCTRRVVHIREFSRMTEEGYPDFNREFFAQRGEHSGVFVPLVRDATSLGVLIVMRRQTEPFTDRHIGLLQSFADQAVIALENTRLFAELQKSNTTLKEALERQTATADILRVIAGSPTDLQRVLDALVASAAQLCRAGDVRLLLLEGETLVYRAQHGALPGARLGTASGAHLAIPFVRCVAERRVVHVRDLQEEARVDDALRAAVPGNLRDGVRAMLAVPLLRGARAVGALYLRRTEPEPFTDAEIALLQTFADQAVIAIENARLFQELQERLEEQTATNDVLRIIAASPTALDPVLDAVVVRVLRLVQAMNASIWTLEGETLCAAAYVGEGAPPRGRRAPLDPNRLYARAVLDRRTVQLDDLAATTPEEWVHPGARRVGTRTMLALPLLHAGRPIGALAVQRSEVRPFTEGEVSLLETFADQAVIAIENTRLFTELRERDERRRGELQRASAIQQRLLPSLVEGWPGALEIAHRFRPAVETSGDFFDVLALPAARGALEPLQVAVGDVAGKGMSAALVTALARSALRATATVPTALATPANALRLAGQRLHEDVGSGHFVACALAVVEPPGTHHAGPRLRLANAAQVPVLLVRDGVATEIEPPGYRLPLGAQDDGDYKDAEVDLRAGDVVVFSSDGLVEAPSLTTAAAPEHLRPSEQPGELFGFARLAAAAAHWSRHAASAEAVAAGMWADLTAWCGDESHHDDVTLLVLRVPEARS